MTRDKELLMAFWDWSNQLTETDRLELLFKNRKPIVDIFLASPEYKELCEIPRYYLSQKDGVVTMEQSKVGAYVHIHDVIDPFNVPTPQKDHHCKNTDH